MCLCTCVYNTGALKLALPDIYTFALWHCACISGKARMLMMYFIPVFGYFVFTLFMLYYCSGKEQLSRVLIINQSINYWPLVLIF